MAESIPVKNYNSVEMNNIKSKAMISDSEAVGYTIYYDDELEKCTADVQKQAEKIIKIMKSSFMQIQSKMKTKI